MLIYYDNYNYLLGEKMRRKKGSKSTTGVLGWILVIVIGLLIGNFSNTKDNNKHQASKSSLTKSLVLKKNSESNPTSSSTTSSLTTNATSSSISNSSSTNNVSGSCSTSINRTPSKDLAESVLSQNVRNQLGNEIAWNNAGAFIIDNNRTTLNTNITSAPYAVNTVDSLGRPVVGNAWLNSTTRQYQNRKETNEGATSWKPAGFEQALNLSGAYKHAYDRGHLLGYALVGGIQNFDASESNPRNIATQTAWANEADSSYSTGQNYYETIVRRGLDQNKKIRYRVSDIYDGSNIVPSGAHIEAKSSDGTIEFNVFVPNVQNGIIINYATGKVAVQ